MGQGNEFNMRYVRGKGFQIIPLSLGVDRFFWTASGIIMGTAWAGVAYHWLTPDHARIACWTATAFFAGYQGQHLWNAHRKMKAMLKEIGMSEKQMLQTLNEIIEEGEKIRAGKLKDEPPPSGQ